MLSQSKRGNRKHRSLKFVPTWSANVSGGLLEPRALTAPLFWRRPSTDPAGASDIVRAGGNVGVNSAFDVINKSTVSGPSELTITGTVDVTVIDLVNPAAPVGTNDVNFSTSSQLTSTLTGPQGPNLNANTASTVIRNYTLADDSTSSGSAATLVETFSFTYTAPTAGSLATASVAFSSPGVTINSGMLGLEINGTSIAANTSNTITVGAKTIAYSYTRNSVGADLNVTITTNVGVLPLSVHNPDGTQSE